MSHSTEQGHMSQEDFYLFPKVKMRNDAQCCTSRREANICGNSSLTAFFLQNHLLMSNSNVRQLHYQGRGHGKRAQLVWVQTLVNLKKQRHGSFTKELNTSFDSSFIPVVFWYYFREALRWSVCLHWACLLMSNGGTL